VFSTCGQQNVYSMSQMCCWQGVYQCIDKHKNEKVKKVTFMFGRTSVTNHITCNGHICFRKYVGCSKKYGKCEVITPCDLGRWWLTLPVKPSFTTCHSIWCHNLEQHVEYLHCWANLESSEWCNAYKLWTISLWNVILWSYIIQI